ncbi:hypothetical protein [Paenibacillus whitsoniae]|uniref:Uncharacterized protein n=1 Tax=Paenibacillus whitsoniae TaxID=2496558 RepID=A0A430JH55_9BACL|nr:hypothetical protein [Paenibacillus whitsoniae]RTE10330.1 hypothetical protein EJQ19_07735 [Paenibacillus whitsoniae]
MSFASSGHLSRQSAPEQAAKSTASSATSEAISEISSLSSLAQMKMLQRTIGNQAVAQMVQRRISAAPSSAQGPVIQRSLDDKDDVTWTTIQLSALWGKMVGRSEGKENIPNYPAVQAHLAGFVGQTHTERALAEKIINLPAIKPMFMNPRKQHLSDTITDPGTNDDDAIKKVLAATVFYHATFEDNIPGIFASGIKASKGGKGNGISTHGRDASGANAEAKKTYNAWSAGHTFITKSKTEAEGYRSKMQTNGGKNAKIIHVFSLPSFIDDSFMKVDIDSVAGIKYEGDLTMIGDRTQLNGNALRVVQQGLKNMNRNVNDADIQRVYLANYA